MIKKLLAIMGCSLAAAGIACAAEAEFPDISIKDLKKAIDDKKVVVIDVNGSESFAKGRVPTALDYAAQKDQLGKLLPEKKDTLIVAYCGGPTCSAYQQAAKAAKALGYTNIKHLSAGISGWLQAEMPTEKGPAKTEEKKES